MSQAGYTHQEAMDKIVELEEKLKYALSAEKGATERVIELQSKLSTAETQVKELTLRGCIRLLKMSTQRGWKARLRKEINERQ